MVILYFNLHKARFRCRTFGFIPLGYLVLHTYINIEIRNMENSHLTGSIAKMDGLLTNHRQVREINQSYYAQ